MKSHSINCQILGMQKAVDELIKRNQLVAASDLVDSLNQFILSNSSFKEHAKYLLGISKEDDGWCCILVPKSFGREGSSKERLIKLFMFDCKPGEAYVMCYHTRGFSGETHKADLPALSELIADGLVKVVKKERGKIWYEYTPKTAIA